MSHSTLAKVADAHLQREKGTSLDAFLADGITTKSVDLLADDLRRITELPISTRTVYRWCDRLGVERPDRRKDTA